VVTELSAIRRLLVIAPLTALFACATTDPARSEVTELRAELRALRETNARLENRLERLEGQAAVLSARGASAPASSAPGSPSPAAAAAKAEPRTEKLEMPRLAVVKLMPKEEKDEGEAVLFTNEGSAPRLDTSTPVQEPSPEVLEELAQVRKAAAPAREEGAGPGPAVTAAEASVLDRVYEAGLEALRTGNVAGGVGKLQRFALENPRHPKADNALYFSGIGQMGLESHAQAARTFEQLLSTYPAGDAVVDTLLKLAECRVRLNQKKDAKALYVQLISQYPGTAAASLAESRLGTLTH